MHKIRYTTILLLAVFCIIPIVSILMIHHLTLTDTLNKMGSGALGKSSLVIKVDGYDNTDDLTDALSAIKGNSAIYSDVTDENGTVRYMFFNRNYINLPMKEGRFFKASDFTKDNAVCVVGKGRSDEIYEKDGDKFFALDGREYRVIGVLGYESDTVLDDYIFVNMLSAELSGSGIFTFDFFDIESRIFLRERYAAGIQCEMVYLSSGSLFLVSAAYLGSLGRKAEKGTCHTSAGGCIEKEHSYADSIKISGGICGFFCSGICLL